MIAKIGFSFLRRKKPGEPKAKKVKPASDSDRSILLDTSRELENEILASLNDPDLNNLDFVNVEYIMRLNLERDAAIRSELSTSTTLEIILRVRQHYHILTITKMRLKSDSEK